MKFGIDLGGSHVAIGLVDDNHEIIEKRSGLVLYSSDESYMRMIEYRFDTVTDKDVEKPNLAEYSLNH